MRPFIFIIRADYKNFHLVESVFKNMYIGAGFIKPFNIEWNSRFREPENNISSPLQTQMV